MEGKQYQGKATVKRFCLALYYFSCAVVYAGWLVQKREFPWIEVHSAKHVCFLATMLLIFVLPRLWGSLKAALGWKYLIYSLAPTVVLGFVGYVIAAGYYYHTRRYSFDPFLQFAPKRFSAVARDKLPNELRVLALGGSTTFLPSRPPETNYPHHLEKYLQRQFPARKVTILNAGRPWYTTKHSLIQYVTYFRSLNPDFVLVLHAINDLYRSFSPSRFAVGDYNDLWSHFYGPAVSGARPPSFERHLWSKLHMIRNWYSGFRRYPVDYPIETYVSITPFEQNLRTLVRYAGFDGCQVLLLTQPSLLKEVMTAEEAAQLGFGENLCVMRESWAGVEHASAASLYRAMQVFNEVTKKVARSERVTWLDTDAILAKDLSHFIDDVHYTEVGAQELAKAVAIKITIEANTSTYESGEASTRSPPPRSPAP